MMNCNNKRYQKSSVRMANNATQSVAVNGNVVYSATTTDTGISISASPSSGSLTLRNAGLYLVLFSGTVNTGTIEGNIILQLTSNGTSVAGASATLTATTTTTTENVTIPYLVSVGGSCCNVNNDTLISVTNAGDVTAELLTATLTAFKLI